MSMKRTDIAIIGGGLEGSIAATRRNCGVPDRSAGGVSDRLPGRKIERRGETRTIFQDRHRRFGAPFGAARRQNWIARFGYLRDKRPSRRFGISYAPIGLTAITTPRSLQALGVARAAAAADCAAFAGVRNRAVGRLRFDNQVTCPGRYRRAYRPWRGVRTTTGP
jgi:hypothetical protein